MVNFSVSDDYPVRAIIGKRGSAKSLLQVALAYYAEQSNISVWTNFNLNNIKYEQTSFAHLATFPDELHDAVVLIDEMHVGADSYSFWSKQTKAITDFATQLRKRRLLLFYASQNFDMIPKRLREQTNIVIQMTRLDAGIARIDVFDLDNRGEFIRSTVFDGRPFYNYYETGEIIKNK